MKDAPIFIKEIVGTDGHFTTEEIAEQLKSLIVTRFSDAAAESDFPIEAFAKNLNELSTFVHQVIGPEFEKYGIEVTFLVENVSMPEDIKKEIFELSRLNAIDLNKLAQMKAAKAMEKAAENESALQVLAWEWEWDLPWLIRWGNPLQVVNNNPMRLNQNLHPSSNSNSCYFFAVINGQQAGPFDINTFKNMVAQKQITKEVLVWKKEWPVD